MHHDMRFWNQNVAHKPIQYVGSLSVFTEFDAREQQRVKQARDREFVRPNLIFMEARRSSEEARRSSRAPSPDYIYTGDEVCGGTLSGVRFRDTLSTLRKAKNRRLVTDYKKGSLTSAHTRDLARYILQEFMACRSHF